MASVDPRTWLRNTPPFHALSASRFERAAAAVEVVYHPAGTRLVSAGGRPLEHLFVIRKGAEILLLDSKDIDDRA